MYHKSNAQTHVCMYYYKILHTLLMGSCITVMFGLYAFLFFALRYCICTRKSIHMYQKINAQTHVRGLLLCLACMHYYCFALL